MFSREFTQPGSFPRITVVLKEHGWELSKETDQGEVQRTLYRDWHRLERALRAIGIDQSLGFPSVPAHG